MTKTEILAELTQLLTPAAESEKPRHLLSLLTEQFAEINHRFERIENHLFASKLLPPVHPSQERFQITEANEIFLPQTNEKACRFEPGKPCDYCSMCSAQGF